MTRPRTAVAVAITAAAVLTSAACTGGSSGSASTSAAPASTSSAPTASPTQPKPKPRPKPAPRKNPYTGVGPVPKQSTIAVKIDDTAPGRPQVGIGMADIVYVEAVEGGLTRIAAIFGTHHPTAVGYVRSTRPSDPDLLFQFGKITEAYSGGAHDSLPRLYRSGIRSWSNDGGARFYSRRARAASSYINLVVNLKRVASVVHTPHPHDIGWTFAASLKGLKLPVKKGYTVRTEVTGSYRRGVGTPVVFHYSRKLGKYVRYIGGVPQRTSTGHLVTARNVIVQKCRVVPHPRDTDINGNPSQFTYTVGHGNAVIFRNGNRIDGTWSRPHVKNGTVWRTRNGARIPLAPGNTWIILVRKGVPVFTH
jgi:Protein of unknown function (DUF3048) N-terminal domain/Protein of unknown function (DUF3048) C-terminal domain